MRKTECFGIDFQPISAIVNARVFDALCRKVFGMAKKFTESRDHSGHTERKQQATRFQPGQSGNPAGRPRGSKNKLSEDFWRDMSEAWEQGGVEAIKRVMQEDPAKFLTIVASALPKDINHKHDASDAFLSLWQLISDGKGSEALEKLRSQETEQVAQSEPDDPEEPVRH
jgi:Family of unknown function (DUF5681)